MLDDWFRPLQFKIAEEDFHRLPRHTAYRYKFRKGEAIVSPVPSVYHAMLPVTEKTFLDRIEMQHPRVTLRLRAMGDRDWPHLVPIFAASMASSVPVQALTAEERLDCAQAAIDRTRSAEDGPIVFPACFVAAGPDDIPQAAILITLIYNGDMETYDDPEWEDVPPVNALETRWGRPHLTWVLVDPPLRRRGVGEALLNCAVAQIHHLGYGELASSFLQGNESSMLWHWKMGFRLLSHVLSPRRLFEGQDP